MNDIKSCADVDEEEEEKEEKEDGEWVWSRVADCICRESKAGVDVNQIDVSFVTTPFGKDDDGGKKCR